MITRYAMAKSLVFDGAEREILSKVLDLGQAATVKFNDFANNNFEDLQQVINNEDFEFIVKTGGFAPDGGFLNLYKNSNINYVTN